MNIIGIVCEYNPFHNGHLYHINKIKELYPDSLIILVLNGYFLQRGEISIISKEDKTSLAIEYGVDIVLELPFIFGTQSADIFADNSIKILETLKCQFVVFGSECNDIQKLNSLCDYVINNENEYNKDIKKYLKEGVNYPTALAKALNTDFEFKPNDLLAISYIKAIKKNNYSIKPLAIQRTSDYLDLESKDNIISASNIRNKLNNKEDIKKYVPKKVTNYINNVDYDKLFELLKFKIITDDNLNAYLDVDEGIENRLKKVITEATSIEELIEKIKSKRWTYNKIRRMLIHILIGLTKEDNGNIVLNYIRPLGFNSKGKDYLNKIKKNLNIPLRVNKDYLLYQYELKASYIYDLLTNSSTIKYEKNNKPIKK